MSRPISIEEIRRVNPKMAAAIERAVKKPEPRAPCMAASGEQRPPAQPAARPSEIVRRFEQQLSAHGLPPYEREWYAIPGRSYRWDYAFIRQRVLVEIQGAQHRIKGRFKADIEKRALALIAGFRVLELDRASIVSEKSVEWLRALLLTKGRRT